MHENILDGFISIIVNACATHTHTLTLPYTVQTVAVTEILPYQDTGDTHMPHLINIKLHGMYTIFSARNEYHSYGGRRDSALLRTLQLIASIVREPVLLCVMYDDARDTVAH